MATTPAAQDGELIPTWQERIGAPPSATHHTWTGVEDDMQAEIADLRAAIAARSQDQGEPEWRCFHCDECFTVPEQAALHFGTSERQGPACQIDLAKFREMEARVRECNEEDSDLHRQIHALQSRHATALLREEEKGYARGLLDAAQPLPVSGAPKVQGEPVAYMNHITGDVITKAQKLASQNSGAYNIPLGRIASGSAQQASEPTDIDRENLRIGQQMQRAASELSDGWNIEIEIERGYGSVTLYDDEGGRRSQYDAATSDGMSFAISSAITDSLATPPDAPAPKGEA